MFRGHLPVAFADAFDVDVSSQLPQEAALHQDLTGGFWDLQVVKGGGAYYLSHPDRHPPLTQTGELTWILPLTPVLSILLAMFTVRPQMSY